MSLRYRGGHELEVRYPKGLNLQVVEQFVLSKKRWVLKQIQVFEDRRLSCPVPEPGEIWWRGSIKKLQPSFEVKKVEWDEASGAVLFNARLDASQVNFQIRKWLRTDLNYRIQLSLDAIPHGVIAGWTADAQVFQIRKMKSKWGSCSHQGAMRFNEALAFLDDLALAYVVNHEASHLVQFNHSAAFYEVLHQIMPNHRSAERHLNLFSEILQVGGFKLP